MSKRDRGKSVKYLLERFEALEQGTSPEFGRMSEHEVRESVKQNLIDLLNTRVHLYFNEEDNTLQRSILGYGIQDFLGIAASSERGQIQFRRQVEKAIELYEPRLTAVTVDLHLHSRFSDRKVFLRIGGDLVLETGTEHVVFESAVEPESQQITVE